MTAGMLSTKDKLQVVCTPSNQTTSLHSKHTATWTRMVVGGQCSSAEWMDQSTFIAGGLIISKGLESLVESSGWVWTRYTV